MHTIEIDFEVYKELTMRRETEEVSYNDVLRTMLELPDAKPKAPLPDMATLKKKLPWNSKGAKFLPGTLFLANYKGNRYEARVEDGQFVMDGKAYPSLSAAAVKVTGNPVNGWRFWFCKSPGETAWRVANSFRPKG